MVALGVPVLGTSASARATYASPYGYERTWNAALRLVRVDNGWKVTEKDDQSGYLIFEYTSPESARATPGSLELGEHSAAPVFLKGVLSPDVSLQSNWHRRRRVHHAVDQHRPDRILPAGSPAGWSIARRRRA